MATVTITPEQVDITVRQNQDVTLKVTYKSTDDQGAESAVDISTDKTVFTVRDEIGGEEKITKTVEAGAHEDGANGIDHFEFTATETDVSEDDRKVSWVYAIKRYTGGGAQFDHFEGAFELDPSASPRISAS